VEYVNLGRSGLKVSRACLGAMMFGTAGAPCEESESRRVIDTFLERGHNFVDTANVYTGGQSEEVTGRAIAAKRDAVVLATKGRFPQGAGPNDGGLSRVHLTRALESSLRRLGTDYIDLYTIHRWDSSTPIKETLQALHDVVVAGKVRYLGASSMWSWQFAKALYLQERHGWHRFVSMQDHYNLLYREEEREMLPLCAAEGIAVTPWSPLARGKLTRDWDATTNRSETDEFGKTLYRYSDAQIVEAVARVAERRGVSRAQVALAWVARNPVVTSPIVGATKPHQLDDALAAIELELTDDEVAELEAPYEAREVAGF
jgi:1-deoxyxylulose-5-phosphate synthase